MKIYDKFVQFDSDFKPIQDISITGKLPPGVYNLKVTPQGELFFSRANTNYDQLLQLPNTKYDEIIKEIDMFLTPECKDRFRKKGWVYKNSILAYGPHGSGKTCIVNRVTEKVLEKQGVVLFCPNPNYLEEAFKILNSVQPDTLVMVIFEELDEILKRQEDQLLSLLDGEIQKDNIIYVATTNNIELIPARIRRPGRFSAVIRVGYPGPEARRYYLEQKMSDVLSAKEITSWVEKTEHFSIDELKEVCRSVFCLNRSLDDTIKRILENKDLSKEGTDASLVVDYLVDDAMGRLAATFDKSLHTVPRLRSYDCSNCDDEGCDLCEDASPVTAVTKPRT